MDNETQKLIDSQLKLLPKNVKEAIVSVDYKTKLQEITQKQKLLIDQAGKLEMETTLVMIGLEPLADYIANIQRELGVTSVKAQEIARDVSESIFKPIRDSLYAMNQDNEEGEGENTEEKGVIQTESRLTGPRSTDSNDSDLNRDQILNEIENPSLIGNTLNNFQKMAVNTTREIETLDEVPYQQDIKVVDEPKVAKTEPEATKSILESKLSGITISSQRVVEAEPEHKLPEIEKRRPFGGVDPYREEIN